MGEFRAVILTEKGLELEAKMRVGNTKMEFTRAATGDGSYSDEESITGRTSLKSQIQEFEIDSLSIVNDVTVYLRFIITNMQMDNELKAGYYIREIGIFAMDPDEGEVLYALAVADNERADYMPAYNNLVPSTITMDFYTEVANAGEVTIRVAGGTYVSREEFNNFKEENNSILCDTQTDTFSPKVSYAKGDYCIYENNLYKFIEDKVAGAWNLETVKRTSIFAELKELFDALGGLKLRRISEQDYQNLPDKDDNTVYYSPKEG